MGMMPPPTTCHITGRSTENYPSSGDLVEYLVRINDRKLLFRFNTDHVNNEFVEKNKHILQGLILNNLFPSEFYTGKSPVLTNEKLVQLIHGAPVPQTPEEKLGNLLIYLHSLQKYEGSDITYPAHENKHDLANKLYFKNYKEMAFYLFTLLGQDLIDGGDASTLEGPDLIGIQLTYYGLAKVIELGESGLKSDRCFIAMSFSDDMKDTRESIKSAVTSAGFKPILIDEIHYDADITINDALIAEIRKCKFLVADFSQHKHGVYFEVGFALGLKRQVIYLCKSDDFSDSHFDTNHYPHIVYSELSDLEEKLKSKIEAWVKL